MRPDSELTKPIPNYTVHTPILIPPGLELTASEKPKILATFATRMKKLIKAEPALRIKVQLPKGISEEDVRIAFRESKK